MLQNFEMQYYDEGTNTYSEKAQNYNNGTDGMTRNEDDENRMDEYNYENTGNTMITFRDSNRLIPAAMQSTSSDKVENKGFQYRSKGSLFNKKNRASDRRSNADLEGLYKERLAA